MAFLSITFCNREEVRLRAFWRFLFQLPINIGLFLGIVFVRAQFSDAAEQSAWSEVIMTIGVIGVP